MDVFYETMNNRSNNKTYVSQEVITELLILKEAGGHGSFKHILEDAGISHADFTYWKRELEKEPEVEIKDIPIEDRRLVLDLYKQKKNSSVIAEETGLPIKVVNKVIAKRRVETNISYSTAEDIKREFKKRKFGPPRGYKQKSKREIMMDRDRVKLLHSLGYNPIQIMHRLELTKGVIDNHLNILKLR